MKYVYELNITQSEHFKIRMNIFRCSRWRHVSHFPQAPFPWIYMIIFEFPSSNAKGNATQYFISISFYFTYSKEYIMLTDGFCNICKYVIMIVRCMNKYDLNKILVHATSLYANQVICHNTNMIKDTFTN